MRAVRSVPPGRLSAARFWDAGKRGIGARADCFAAQNKGGKKLKDLQAEKGVAPAAEPVADAPAAAEEEEAKESGGDQRGTPPVEEAPPAAKAEAEEAPKAKEPEAKAPPPPEVKQEHKEEAKPAAEAKKEDDKKEEHSHNDGELMHQHPKDCFLTLWPGILSVRGPGEQPASGGALPLPRSLGRLRPLWLRLAPL